VSEHPQFDEDFDLYALGVLEGDDKEALELHLAFCEDCTRRLEAARGRGAVLALAALAQVPRPELRARLLRRVHHSPSRGGAAQPVPARLLRWTAPVLALAALFLAIMYGHLQRENANLRLRIQDLEAQQRTLQEQTGRARAVLDVLTAPDTLQITLVKGRLAPAPQGKAFYNPAKGLLFYAANLPALPSGKTYELWLIPTQGNPIPAGTFNPDPKGNAEVVLPQLRAGIAAKALAITVEPAGGLPKPSSSPVLLGAVS
jgi:anti-sigma-K factor RskA